MTAQLKIVQDISPINRWAMNAKAGELMVYYKGKPPIGDPKTGEVSADVLALRHLYNEGAVTFCQRRISNAKPVGDFEYIAVKLREPHKRPLHPFSFQQEG